MQGFAQQKKQTATVTYEFPKEMIESVKAEYIKMCDKGKILYDLNCAKCHNKTVNKQVIIPDFTPEALRGYEIRVLNADHEKDMPDELVTAEELVLISTFLTYKKKNAPSGSTSAVAK